MKKLIAIALLAFASTAVFAGEVSPAVRSTDVAPVVDASTSAADAPVTAPASSALEKGATKLGSVLGGVFRTTYKLGKAVGEGVREGFSDKGAKSADVGSSPTPSQAAVSEPAPTKASGTSNPLASAFSTTAVLNPLGAAFSNPLSSKLASAFKRNKDQQDAPIDDRSVLASNPN